jgi:hypothetical protein
MERIQIRAYALAWNPKNNKGFVKLQLQGGRIEQIDADAADFAAFAAVLRVHSAYWDDASGALVTDWETP